MDYDAELKKYRTTAEEILKELKEQPKLTYEQFEGLLRAYAMARFLLPADTDEDEIDKLAAVSIARIYQIPAEKLIQTDKPSGCTYATSVSDKKVLLILSLQKALGVKFDGTQTVKIKTLTQLTNCLWKRKEVTEDGMQKRFSYISGK